MKASNDDKNFWMFNFYVDNDNMWEALHSWHFYL